MNPMNWISATGRKPWAAMPTAIPVIRVSASGVSMTRRKPKRSCNPRVARNTPPLGPTSSPSTTTSGSSVMARCSARLMASTMHSVFCSAMLTSRQSPGPLQPLVPLRCITGGQLLVQVIEGCRWLRLGERAEGLHRSVDLLTQLPVQALLLRLVPQPLLVQEPLQAAQRFTFPRLAQFLGGAIAAGIVRGSVVAQTVGDAFDQRRALAGPGTLDGGPHPVVYRQHIIAIHLLPGNTRRQRLVRQGRRGGLQTARYRNRPLVVVDHEYHRQLPHPGQVQTFEKIALAGGAIPAGGDGDPGLLTDTEGGGHTTGMAGLGGNGHTDGEILDGGGRRPGAAALVSTPVQQDVLHMHPTLQLGGGIAVVGNQHIGVGHRTTQSRTNGLLPERGRVGAYLAGALQGNTFLIEQPHQIHLAVQLEQQRGIIHPARQVALRLALVVQITGKGNLHG